MQAPTKFIAKELDSFSRDIRMHSKELTGYVKPQGRNYLILMGSLNPPKDYLNTYSHQVPYTVVDGFLVEGLKMPKVNSRIRANVEWVKRPKGKIKEINQSSHVGRVKIKEYQEIQKKSVNYPMNYNLFKELVMDQSLDFDFSLNENIEYSKRELVEFLLRNIVSCPPDIYGLGGNSTILRLQMGGIKKSRKFLSYLHQLIPNTKSKATIPTIDSSKFNLRTKYYQLEKLEKKDKISKFIEDRKSSSILENSANIIYSDKFYEKKKSEFLMYKNEFNIPLPTDIEIIDNKDRLFDFQPDINRFVFAAMYDTPTYEIPENYGKLIFDKLEDLFDLGYYSMFDNYNQLSGFANEINMTDIILRMVMNEARIRQSEMDMTKQKQRFLGADFNEDVQITRSHFIDQLETFSKMLELIQNVNIENEIFDVGKRDINQTKKEILKVYDDLVHSFKSEEVSIENLISQVEEESLQNRLAIERELQNMINGGIFLLTRDKNRQRAVFRIE